MVDRCSDDPDRDDLAALREEFPGWRLWLSREGRMVCAYRLNPSVGVYPTLVEDSVEQMRAELERQRERAAKRRNRDG